MILLLHYNINQVNPRIFLFSVKDTFKNVKIMAKCSRNNLFKQYLKTMPGTLREKKLHCFDKTESVILRTIPYKYLHQSHNILTILPFGCNSGLRNQGVYFIPNKSFLFYSSYYKITTLCYLY